MKPRQETVAELKANTIARFKNARATLKQLRTMPVDVLKTLQQHLLSCKDATDYSRRKSAQHKAIDKLTVFISKCISNKISFGEIATIAEDVLLHHYMTVCHLYFVDTYQLQRNNKTIYSDKEVVSLSLRILEQLNIIGLNQIELLVKIHHLGDDKIDVPSTAQQYSQNVFSELHNLKQAANEMLHDKQQVPHRFFIDRNHKGVAKLFAALKKLPDSRDDVTADELFKCYQTVQSVMSAYSQPDNNQSKAQVFYHNYQEIFTEINDKSIQDSQLAQQFTATTTVR